MSEQERYDPLIAAIKAKAAEILPKGSRVALYGSRARGDARPDSDWDLHILVPGEEKLPLDRWDDYAWPLEQIGFDFNEFVTPRLYSRTKCNSGIRLEKAKNTSHKLHTVSPFKNYL